MWRWGLTLFTQARALRGTEPNAWGSIQPHTAWTKMGWSCRKEHDSRRLIRNSWVQSPPHQLAEKTSPKAGRCVVCDCQGWSILSVQLPNTHQPSSNASTMFHHFVLLGYRAHLISLTQPYPIWFWSRYQGTGLKLIFYSKTLSYNSCILYR